VRTVHVVGLGGSMRAGLTSPAALQIVLEGAAKAGATVRLFDDGRPPGRLTADVLTPMILTGHDIYVCGSTAFCNSAADLITNAGVSLERIKVERFGFSG
jgi:ferredoxin-NADP reductase